MGLKVVVAYNEPVPSRYDAMGEGIAVSSVMDSVSAVEQSLRELGYDVTKLPLLPPPEEARQRLRSAGASLIFNLFEGFCGQPETETLVPEAAAGMGVPYTGCPAEALALALDKARAKELLQCAGIPTPAFQLLTPLNLDAFRLGYPCIVKPVSEDASHGLSEASVVHDRAALSRQVAIICRAYGGEALVEQFIDGQEFNATVLGDSAGTVLSISEIDYSLPAGLPRILTFAAKWETGSQYCQGTSVVCPARIAESTARDISAISLAAFRLLVRCGYARVDLRMDSTGRLNVLEVNPNPDISPGTGAARQAEAAGMTYTQFIARLVALALEG